MKNFIIWAIVMVAGNYMAAKWYLHYSVSTDLDAAIVMMSPFADIQYEGVSSTMTGDLSIDGITARVGEFKDEIYIDKMSIITPSFLHLINLGDIGYDVGEGELDFPNTLGFAMTGIRAPIGADYIRWAYNESLKETVPGADAEEPAAQCTGKYGFSPSDLEQLGYRFMDVSFTMIYEQEDAHFMVDMSIDVEEMWDLALSMKLDGNMSEQATTGAYRPKLVEGTMQYTDRSLNERIRENCVRAGLNEEQIVAAMMDAFAYNGVTAGIEYDEYVMDPYRDFIAGKTQFVMTAKPSEPVALSQIDLYKPSDVPALLNLSAMAQ